MKLSCQEHIVPGASFAEKVAFLTQLGFSGIELTQGERGVMEGSLRQRIGEIRDATASGSVRPSVVCTKVYDLLHTDPAARRAAMAQVLDALEVAAAVGALGAIIVPRFGPPMIPDLSPVYTPRELEHKLIVSILRELAPRAEKLGTLIMLEPLHRYIVKFLRTVEHGLQICAEVNSPNVCLMIDVFQSYAEELSVPESIRKAGRLVRHVHLSDHNRRLPGQGNTDFRAIFRATRDIGFSDYLSFECDVFGDKAAEVRAAAAFIKQELQASQEAARS